MTKANHFRLKRMDVQRCTRSVELYIQKLEKGLSPKNTVNYQKRFFRLERYIKLLEQKLHYTTELLRAKEETITVASQLLNIMQEKPLRAALSKEESK
ncbi:MAG: hypothetical protein ACRC5H_03805 [Treponemataceae bacterium]